MIKILFITPRFGSIDRGVEIFTKEISRRLNKHKFSVSIASAGHNLKLESVKFSKVPIIKRELISGIIKKLPLDKISALGAAELESLSLMVMIVAYLFLNRFDIIIPQGGYFSVLGANLFRKKARIVAIGHSGPDHHFLNKSDHFVALTPFDQQRAFAFNPKIGSCVIPNGVDCRSFKSNIRSESEQYCNNKILCVGAFTKDKRHDLLFDALSHMDESFKLTCVGDGPEKEKLMRHPLSLEGRIEFLCLKHSEMPRIYRKYKVFTLASPGEAFGIVFLEALASGLSVVAHNGPRQAYVLGSAGYLCNVFNPKEYALTIEKAIKAHDIQRNLKQAEKFDWDVITRQYEQLFCRLSG